MHVRLMLAVVVAVCGLVVVPGTARSVPGICPPFCDSIPDAAWIESSSLPLYPVYRWPGLAALAVDAPAPRFGFEGWCASPTVADDPRDYVVAARAEVSNPDGQWNLRVQVLHWRGPVTAGGPIALETLEKARMALALCHLTAPAVSPSITSSDAERLATVISEFQPQATRQAEDDVLQNAQVIHQHEMLVDHANTIGQGLTGRVD